MFIQTDDYQYRRSLGDRRYLLVEAVKRFEGMQLDEEVFDVYSGVVDIGDYRKEEIRDIVFGYYDSYEEFLDIYKDVANEELDELIAEMVFESEILDHEHLGHFVSEEEAIAFMEQWMKDHDEIKEEEKEL